MAAHQTDDFTVSLLEFSFGGCVGGEFNIWLIIIRKSADEAVVKKSCFTSVNHLGSDKN